MKSWVISYDILRKMIYMQYNRLNFGKWVVVHTSKKANILNCRIWLLSIYDFGYSFLPSHGTHKQELINQWHSKFIKFGHSTLQMNCDPAAIMPFSPDSSILSSAFSATRPKNCKSTYKVSRLIKGSNWMMCCKWEIWSWIFLQCSVKENKQKPTKVST